MTKNMRHVAAAAVILAGASNAFATNGVNLIGLSAEQRGMGGVGISVSHGAQSALVNPALVEGKDFSIAGTWFSPNVSFGDKVQGMNQGYEKSKSSNFVMPEVALSYEVNKWFTWGLGMFGVSGMGVDYRNDPAITTTDATTGAITYSGTQNGTNQLFSQLQVMRFAVPLAFRPVEGLSIAAAPIFQYGSLGISYNNGATAAIGMDPTTGIGIYNNTNSGYGVSTDYAWGWNIGAAYEIVGVTIGAVYTSKIDASYANQISTAATNFGLTGPYGFSDSLDSPAEVGVGVSWNIMESGHTVGFDWKQIMYGNAEGYKDFGWENQNVFMVGYQYEAEKSWAVRIGYNYAKNPIKQQGSTVITAADMGAMQTTGDMAPIMGKYRNSVINYFNNGAFPAVVEQHYTIGGTVFFTDSVSLSLSYVYAPEVKVSSDTSGLTQMQMLPGMMQGQYTADQVLATRSSADVKHSQNSITAGLNISF